MNKKRLALIEHLVGEDTIFKSIDELKTAIYKIAHPANGCNDHKEWEKQTLTDYKFLKEKGYF